MALLAATGGFNDIATWVTPLLIAVIGGYLVLFKGGVKSKDESHDKDLLLLKKDMQAEINKERGSREKFQIKVNNNQTDFNRELIALVNKIDDNQEKGIERWNEFTRYQQRWADKISETVQHTSRELIQVNGKLNDIDSKIEAETKNIRSMADKSLGELNEAKVTYRKASEKTTQ